MDTIGRGLKERRILSEPFSWLTVTVDGSQGFQTDIREFAGRCSNNRSVFIMQFFEMGHKRPGEHPLEVWEPGSCKKLRARILSQGMQVKVIENVCNEISYGLETYVSVSN